MNIRRLLLLITTLIALISLPLPTSLACDCRFGGGPPCEEFWKADAVFSGTVTALSIISTQETDTSGDQYTIRRVVARFSIEDSFRGIRGAETEVLTGMGGGDCGYQFKKGERYLVYANYNHRLDNKLYAGICGRTRLLTDAAEDLRYFQNLPGAGSGSSILGEVMLHSVPLNEEGKFNRKPMEGIRIVVKGQNGFVQALTDKDGRYLIAGLEPGVYKIHPDLPANLYERSPSEIKVIDRGCVGVDFWAALNGKIRGRVVDSNGQPVVGVKVDIVPANGATSESMPGKSRFTNEEGHYAFDWIPPGSYLLGVNLIGSTDAQCPRQRTYYPGVPYSSDAQAIAIGEGQELQDYDLQLPPQPPERTIEGVVVWPDGRPAVRVGVVLSTGQKPHYRIGKGSGTDEKGRFALKAAEGCSYQIQAFTYGGRVNSESDEIIKSAHAEPVTIDVTSERVAPLKLVLASPGLHRENEQGASQKPSQKPIKQ